MSAQDLEQRARELLAAEVEARGLPSTAKLIRDGDDVSDFMYVTRMTTALRAIVAALRQQPAPVDLEQFREAVEAVGESCADHEAGETGYCHFYKAVPWLAKLYLAPPQPAPVVDDARMARALEWVRDAAEGDAGYREYLPIVEEVFAAYNPNCGARTVRVVDDAMVRRAWFAGMREYARLSGGLEDDPDETDLAAMRAALNAARAQGVQS